jgi:NTE family protein
VATGELTRFRNHPHKNEAKTEIGPRQVLASGSLPPGFPATAFNGARYWDGGIVDNTPLGDAIGAFSGSGEVDRILVVMNLFRKNRALPKNMVEVNDRLDELRYGNRLRQDGANAHAINGLADTVAKLAALVPDDARDSEIQALIDDAGRFKVLDFITEIDLADPELMAQAGLPLGSEESGAFRDFSAAAIARRHDAGYKLARLKLQKLFEEHGLLISTH